MYRLRSGASEMTMEGISCLMMKRSLLRLIFKTNGQTSCLDSSKARSRKMSFSISAARQPPPAVPQLSQSHVADWGRIRLESAKLNVSW